MLDDRRAEHVPGCNMAFVRHELLKIGGFDEQFRQAGDDVDICWRFLDAGLDIGYASAALVWHHRRNTLRAYLKQQKGYGQSEAMLHFKHPQRFNTLGCSQWRGIIYGEGAVGLPVVTPAVYHGRFGTGLFQILYRKNEYSPLAYVTLLEWHGLALLVLALAMFYPPLALVSAVMWCATLLAALRSTAGAPLPQGAPLWCRPVIFVMYLAQPVVRAWHRHLYRLRHKRLREIEVSDQTVVARHVKAIWPNRYDMYFRSDRNHGRGELLDALVQQAAAHKWPGDFHSEWDEDDVALVGDRWQGIHLRTATEELGWPERFTRVACSLKPTSLAYTVAIVGQLVTAGALVRFGAWASIPAVVFWIALWITLLASRRRCVRAVSHLIWRAGKVADLEAVCVHRPARPEPHEEAEGIATMPTPVPAPSHPMRPAAKETSPPRKPTPVQALEMCASASTTNRDEDDELEPAMLRRVPVGK
jgi:hypothetical protein